MKRLTVLLAALVLLVFSTPVYAGPFSSTPDPKPVLTTPSETTYYDLTFSTIFSSKENCPTGGCPQVSTLTVPYGSHAHRKTDGTLLIHSNDNWGNALAHEGITSPWWRVAEGGQTISTTTTVFHDNQTHTATTIFRPFAGIRQRIRERGLWFPGKNLFRAFRGRSTGC